MTYSHRQDHIARYRVYCRCGDSVPEDMLTSPASPTRTGPAEWGGSDCPAAMRDEIERLGTILTAERTDRGADYERGKRDGDAEMMREVVRLRAELATAHEAGRRAMCIQAGGYPDSDLDGWAEANKQTVGALDEARERVAVLEAADKARRDRFFALTGKTLVEPEELAQMTATAIRLQGEVDDLRARPCPHVVTSKEGTSYCELAEYGSPAEYEVIRNETGTEWGLVRADAAADSPARIGTPVSVWRFRARSYEEARGWHECLMAVHHAERNIPVPTPKPAETGDCRTDDGRCAHCDMLGHPSWECPFPQ